MYSKKRKLGFKMKEMGLLGPAACDRFGNEAGS
jgi:hypothetical protein